MLKTRWSESGWPVKVSDGRWPMADGRNSWSNSSRSSRSSASSDTDAIPDLIPISIHRGRCRHGHQLQPNYRNPIRTDKSILTQMLDFFLGGGKPLSLHPITSFQFHHPIPMFLILFSASPSQNFIYTVVILIEFGVIDSTDWMVFQSRPLKEVIGYIQSHWTWSWWVNMDLIPITLIYRLCYERVFVGRGRARA